LLALAADPTNQQTRYVLLEPWFNDVMTGREVPDYVTTNLPLLDGTAKATFEGLEAIYKDDLMQLAVMDAVLAEVKPSDYWYSTSVKLRADWRIRVTTPEYQPRFANEATALIDSAIVFTHDMSFLALRIKSTMLAEDYVSSLQTATRLAYRISNLDFLAWDAARSPSDTEVNRNLSYIKEVDALLTLLESNPQEGITDYELESLRDTVDWTRDELEGFAANL